MRAFVKGKLFFTQTLFQLSKHKITVKQDYFSLVNKLLLIAELFEIHLEQMHCRLRKKLAGKLKVAQSCE